MSAATSAKGSHADKARINGKVVAKAAGKARVNGPAPLRRATRTGSHAVKVAGRDKVRDQGRRVAGSRTHCKQHWVSRAWASHVALPALEADSKALADRVAVAKAATVAVVADKAVVRVVMAAVPVAVVKAGRAVTVAKTRTVVKACRVGALKVNWSVVSAQHYLFVSLVI